MHWSSGCATDPHYPLTIKSVKAGCMKPQPIDTEVLVFEHVRLTRSGASNGGAILEHTVNVR